MANDNIYPDQSNSALDIKYAQLLILSSDIRRNLGGGQTSSGSTGESSGGDDIPTPPGGSGCEKIWRGNLNQSGASDPTARVFKNQLGGTIVWTRIDAGVYFGTLAGAFPSDTASYTWVMLNNPLVEGMSSGAGFLEIRATRIDSDTIIVVTRISEPDDELADNLLVEASLEIAVYCQLQDETCVAVPSLANFSLPVGSTGESYLYQVPLTGTQPMTLTVTEKPDWMSIVIISGGILQFSGTVDTSEEAPVSFSVSNCGATAEVSTTILTQDLTAVPYRIIQELQDIAAGTEVSVEFHGMAADQGGLADWGDGTSDNIDSGAGGTVVMTHTYAAARYYVRQTFHFFANPTITEFLNDSNLGAESTKLVLFTHTDNFTGLARATLYGVIDTAGVIPPAATNINWFEIHAHPTNTETSISFASLPAVVHLLTIRSYPLLQSANSIPSTVTSQLFMASNSQLTAIDYNGTSLSLLQIQGSPVLPASVFLAMTNLGAFISIVLNNSFSTSDVNDILVYIDGQVKSSGAIQLVESPSAPPSGAGLTAKSNLQGRGVFVSTD